MKKLDKDKMLEWLDEQADKQFNPVTYKKIMEIYKVIESGRFDVEEEQSND